MAAADGYPELGLDGLCNIPVGAALAEADGGDPVAGDLEFEGWGWCRREPDRVSGGGLW